MRRAPKEKSPPAATGGARKNDRTGIAIDTVDSIFGAAAASESSPEEAVQPQVAAARERDREARARLARNEEYRPSRDELIQARAWRRRRLV